MKNLLTKFAKEENGDVVQYIIVLAVIVVILVFAFPKIKTMIGKSTKATEEGVDKTMLGTDGDFKYNTTP